MWGGWTNAFREVRGGHGHTSPPTPRCRSPEDTRHVVALQLGVAQALTAFAAYYEYQQQHHYCDPLYRIINKLVLYWTGTQQRLHSAMPSFFVNENVEMAGALGQVRMLGSTFRQVSIPQLTTSAKFLGGAIEQNQLDLVRLLFQARRSRQCQQDDGGGELLVASSYVYTSIRDSLGRQHFQMANLLRTVFPADTSPPMDDLIVESLHEATKQGDAHLVQRIIRDLFEWDIFPHGIVTSSRGGVTAIHVAAAAGHVDVLVLLLRHLRCENEDQPPIINTLTSRWPAPPGRTPLHCSVNGAHLECTKELLRSGGCIKDLDVGLFVETAPDFAREHQLSELEDLFSRSRSALPSLDAPSSATLVPKKE